MAYVRQDSFQFGEIDEINFNETSSPFYLKSLKSAKNMLVSNTAKLVKRTGFKNIKSLSDETIGPKLTADTRMFGFFAEDNEYYIIFATNLEFSFYKVSDGSFVTPIATPYVNAELKNIKDTNGENNIIFVHPDNIQARLDESAGTFTYTPFSFAQQPVYDFGDVNYNSAVTTMAGGTTVTFTLTVTGVTTFTTDWVGGLVIGGGNNINDPIGYGVITSVVVGANTVFTGTVKIDFKDGTFSGSDFSIRKPIYSATLGFPSAVILFQNRLWFANTKTLKNTIAGSKINQFDNFDVGIGRDNDAIIDTLGDTNAGEIEFLNSGKQIEIYTRNFEYVSPQPNGIALTPSSFTARLQSSYGVSKDFQPINYGNNSYYMGRGGKSLFKFEFQGLGESYASENISFVSSHLIKSPTSSAVVQSTINSQENYLFLLNNDSTLTCYQFSDAAAINSFTPLTFGDETNVNIIDIIDIDNKFYMLVFLKTSSKYILARFDEDFYHDFYQVKTLPANGVITGLTDYEGYTVSVVFEGQGFGDYVVSSGQITVDNPDMDTGDCTVGLTYNVEIKPLSPFDGAKLTDAFKKTSFIYIDYFNSLNFNVNGKLVPYKTFAEIQAGDELMPKTGTAKISTAKGWRITQDIEITQSSPLPLSILSISYQIQGDLI